MRVVHVAPRFPPAEGGGERHVARLTAALAARGHEVTVLTTKLLSEVPPRDDPRLPDEEVVDGVRVERMSVRPTGLPVWGYGYTVPGLAKRVAALGPDVVHVHGYGYATGDALARVRSRGAPWRLVMTSHGFIPGRGPLAVAKALYDATRGRATARTLDAAIAINPLDAERFRALGARRVEVIANGVEAERFASARVDPALLARHGLREAAYLLNVARLERIKGQDLLLEAFHDLAADDAALRLVIVGEGREENHLKGLAQRLGIEDRVLFTGRLGDNGVAALAKGALAWVHTPRDEPFGIVLLEGMAAGVPVLATAVGGIPFTAGDAALLVEPSAKAVADGVQRLVHDKALREGLVQRGAARARDLSWESNAAQVEGLYREVARGPP
jgi:D-inositol-3-phosphate glycosyltransferase